MGLKITTSQRERFIRAMLADYNSKESLKITTSQRERFISFFYGIEIETIESQNNYLSKREVYRFWTYARYLPKMSQNNYLSKREVYYLLRKRISGLGLSQNNYLSKREVYSYRDENP